jgi:hypothetical protein
MRKEITRKRVEVIFDKFIEDINDEMYGKDEIMGIIFDYSVLFKNDDPIGYNEDLMDYYKTVLSKDYYCRELE